MPSLRWNWQKEAILTTRSRGFEQDKSIMNANIEAEHGKFKRALEAILAIEPVKMGDHYSWEWGLEPDEVKEVCREALDPETT